MLKFGSNIIMNLFIGKHNQRVRKSSYWTDIYPSPQPCWARNILNKTGDWIYNSIDNFFQGPVNRQNSEFYSDSFDLKVLNPTQVEWELNQHIADIALKDITSSLSWIIPGFLRKQAYRLQQVILLYFFTDVVNEEDSPEWDVVRENHNDRQISVKGKILYTLQGFKDRINADCLSIDIWQKKFISRLKVFLRLKEEMKTYYLLGYFAPQGIDFIINCQDRMIRRSDKSKLNPVFSFHTRI